MLAVVWALVLATAAGTDSGLAPGDALGLEPTPVVASPIGVPRAPIPRGTGLPLDGVAGAVGVGLGAAALEVRRRRETGAMHVVVVHGDGGSPEDFDGLLYRMGVHKDRVTAFDYRSVVDADTSTSASRRAGTSDAAAALDAVLRTAAAQHGRVYSIHHSKGGAVGVEVIAAIDEGRRPPIDGYQGAALLDPAIADGALGVVQRLGGPVPQLPDNGGFDPIRCSTGGCRDIREHLGDRAGVEVVVIRNPDALVTNFVDEPAGLRTHELVDDGGPTPFASWWNPLGFVGRVFEAHGSVLRHRAVVDCVGEEIAAPGSCTWSGDRRPNGRWWGRGGGGLNAFK